MRAGTVTSDCDNICINLVYKHLASQTVNEWFLLVRLHFFVEITLRSVHGGTCMNPCAASSWCSLLRASFPAMMPVWRPTSPLELGAAAGFHLGYKRSSLTTEIYTQSDTHTKLQNDWYQCIFTLCSRNQWGSDRGAHQSCAVTFEAQRLLFHPPLCPHMVLFLSGHELQLFPLSY